MRSISAHKEAYEVLGIIHRDVSAGNIMIIISSTKDDRRGLLNDWDLARKIKDVKAGGAKQHERTVCDLYVDD